MMRRMTIGCGVLLMAMACIGQAAPPQPPQHVPEAPAMGGEPQTKNQPPVINLKANEVALSHVTGAGLIHSETKPLGQVGGVLYQSERNAPASVPIPVGTITAALFDPAKNAITFVAVNPAKGNGPVAVPWSQLEPFDQPHDQFSTAMSAKQFAQAAPLDQVMRSGKLLNAKEELIGRPVASADGKVIGTLADLAVETRSGRIDYAMIAASSGIQLGSNNAAKAIPWSKLKRVSGDKSHALAMTINRQQLAAAPDFATSKAQQTKGMNQVSKEVGAVPPTPH